ncbi:hypothetical protein EfmAA96_05930 [Enterococcus faecium]|nr:hypothetical protein EfmAA96_05930 [Enterococcus faecium]
MNSKKIINKQSNQPSVVRREEFDWTIDQEKYIYPNHRGIDHYDRFKEDLAKI